MDVVAHGRRGADCLSRRTEIRIRAEDRLLAERFGESFVAYRSRIGAYIPFVR